MSCPSASPHTDQAQSPQVTQWDFLRILHGILLLADLCPGSVLSPSADTATASQAHQVLGEQTEGPCGFHPDSNGALFSLRHNSPMLIYDLQKGQTQQGCFDQLTGAPAAAQCRAQKGCRQLCLTVLPTSATYLHIIRGNRFSQRARFNFHSFQIGTDCHLQNRFLKYFFKLLQYFVNFIVCIRHLSMTLLWQGLNGDQSTVVFLRTSEGLRGISGQTCESFVLLSLSQWIVLQTLDFYFAGQQIIITDLISILGQLIWDHFKGKMRETQRSGS